MTKKMVIPWELKADFRLRGYAGVFKAFMYAIREKYGAAAAIEIKEMIDKMDDRTRNLTNTILTIFKIEGNDAEAIGKFWDVYCELSGIEYSWLVRSKTCYRSEVTKCPWKTEFKDLFGWNLLFQDIIVKTINPKATAELPIAMCKGDSHCEYVYKIEE